MHYEGVHVATITPFDSQGQVDWQAAEKHFEFLYSQGVQGLVPCATTGENPTLKASERIKLIQLAVEISKKHSGNVMAGCGSNCTETALRLIGEAKEVGAQAALVVTPYYNRPTMSGVIAHYLYLAERSPLPIVLYNVPIRTNVNLTVDAIAELFKHPKIVGIKEASGQYAQWLAISHRCNLREKHLLSGDDDAFAAILALGGRGIVSATANLIPKHFVDIYEAAKNKQWEAVHRKQTALVPLVKSMFLESNPAPVKFAMKERGRLPSDALRLPLVGCSDSTKAQIREALRGLDS